MTSLLMYINRSFRSLLLLFRAPTIQPLQPNALQLRYDLSPFDTFDKRKDIIPPRCSFSTFFDTTYRPIMRIAFVQVLVLSLICPKPTIALPSADSAKRESESTTPLEIVQAQVPPRSNYDNPSCAQTIFNHVFASSYGIPYVGKKSNFRLS